MEHLDVPPTPLPFQVAVVLPAGGSGLRVGTPTPKQYWEMNGLPLIYYTLSTLQQLDWIQKTVVPVASDMLSYMKTQAEKWGFDKIHFVIGGSTRHRSIQKGLDELSRSEAQPDVVVIHDAVRPFVEGQDIWKVVRAAYDHGAAGLVLPLVSTVIRPGQDGFLEESLDRSQYRASQTPQAFQMNVIRRAYDKCSDHDLDYGTECLQLALHYAKTRAKLVDGRPNVWKVTYKQDLFAATHQIRQKLRQVAIVFGGGRGIGRETVRNFRDQGLQVIAVSRTEKDLKWLAEKCGCVPIVADVTDPAQVENVFDVTLERFDRIDIVVNSAAIASRRTLAETVGMICIPRLNGTFHSCRHAMKVMKASRKGGVIINMGSSGTIQGRPEQGAYTCTKAAVQSLTDTLAIEGREFGICAFSIIPRRTDTPLRQQLYPTEDPQCRLNPAEVANIIVSVALEANPLLSGQAYFVR